MRKEDKIFDYAFGDLDAHEAQVFEAGLLKDEITAEEAKFLQSIKGDLVSLRDIPEMQYSKERLRHAILGQGLKPSRPGFPWLNWLLAPGAAACVVALGYILMNGTKPRQEPALAGTSPEMASKALGGDPKLTPPTVEKDSPKVAVNTEGSSVVPQGNGMYMATQQRPSSRKNVFHLASSRISHRIHSESPMLAMNAVKTESIDKISDSLTNSASLAGAASMAIASQPQYSLEINPSMKSEPTPATDAKIIMIDKDQDSGFGAPTATEVSDTKNVVIGG